MSLKTYLRESMTRERLRANARMTELALAYESRNADYFAKCEEKTLARVSRTIPHGCASMQDGTIITCAESSGNIPSTIKPYERKFLNTCWSPLPRD